jgi:hypothetical protein
MNKQDTIKELQERVAECMRQKDEAERASCEYQETKKARQQELKDLAGRVALACADKNGAIMRRDDAKSLVDTKNDEMQELRAELEAAVKQNEYARAAKLGGAADELAKNLARLADEAEQAEQRLAATTNAYESLINELEDQKESDRLKDELLRTKKSPTQNFDDAIESLAAAETALAEAEEEAAAEAEEAAAEASAELAGTMSDDGTTSDDMDESDEESEYESSEYVSTRSNDEEAADTSKDSLAQRLVDLCVTDDGNVVPRADMTKKASHKKHVCVMCNKTRKTGEVYNCCRTKSWFKDLLEALVTKVSEDDYNDKILPTIYASSQQIDVAAYEMDCVRKSYKPKQLSNKLLCAACGQVNSKMHKTLVSCSIMQVMVTLRRAMVGLPDLSYNEKVASMYQNRLKARMVDAKVDLDVDFDVVVVPPAPPQPNRRASLEDVDPQVERLQSEAEHAFEQQSKAEEMDRCFLVFNPASELAERRVALHKSAQGIEYGCTFVAFLSGVQTMLKELKKGRVTHNRIVAALEHARCVYEEPTSVDDSESESNENFEFVPAAAAAPANDDESMEADMSVMAEAVESLDGRMMRLEQQIDRNHNEVMTFLRALATRLPQSPVRPSPGRNSLKRGFSAAMDDDSSLPALPSVNPADLMKNLAPRSIWDDASLPIM